MTLKLATAHVRTRKSTLKTAQKELNTTDSMDANVKCLAYPKIPMHPPKLVPIHRENSTTAKIPATASAKMN